MATEQLLLACLVWYVLSVYFPPVQFVNFHVFVNLTRTVNILVGLGAPRHDTGSWSRELRLGPITLIGSLTNVHSFDRTRTVVFRRYLRVTLQDHETLTLWVYPRNCWRWECDPKRTGKFGHKPLYGTSFTWR